MNNEVSGFYIRQPGPASTLQQVLAGAPLKVGSTGIGGDQHAFTAALNSLLGTKLKAIAGYPGTQEIMLAVERGELDGIVGYSWGVARSGNKSDLESGKLKIILQLALDKHKELADVPIVTDFVRQPGRSAGARDDLLAPVDGTAAGRTAGARSARRRCCCARGSRMPCAIRS